MADIKVYGADWCSMTKKTLSQLDKLKIPYVFIDIDKDRSAAAWVASQNNGKEKKPTLDIDGTVLSEPSERELDTVLREKGMLLGG